MDTIKPLAKLTRDEVRVLASCAADRGDLENTNPYEPGTEHHAWFQTYHRDRKAERQPA